MSEPHQLILKGIGVGFCLGILFCNFNLIATIAVTIVLIGCTVYAVMH